MEYDRLKNETVDFVVEWTDEALKDYIDPDRKGTPKGEKIGLSKKKRRAAYLMTLHPEAASLREIAEIAGTSEGTIKVWRTQGAFNMAMDEGAEALGSWIYSRLDAHAKRFYEGVGEEESNRIQKEIWSLCLALQFLNLQVAGHVIGKLGSSHGADADNDPERRKFREFSHAVYLNKIKEYRHLVGGGTLTEWERKPHNIEINKALINRAVDLIADPRTWENEESRKKGLEEAERLKKFVSNLLNTMAGIQGE